LLAGVSQHSRGRGTTSQEKIKRKPLKNCHHFLTAENGVTKIEEHI